MTTHGLGGDYPTDWESFIGQDQAKQQLLTAVRSAKIRGAVLGHTLLASGKPGIGKTSLALLVAGELGREVKVISGKIPPNQARIALSGLEDGDVLIYDEIHMAVSGGQANAEWLLHYLQDGVIMGPTGPEEQPQLTVIGCTTEPGRLPKAIIERFTFKPPLEHYSRDEAGQIGLTFVSRMFSDELPIPSTENMLAIADAANCNPRMIKAILTNLRDIALTTDMGNHDGGQYDVTQALDWLGLTEDGLDLTCRRYLVALLTDFQGGAGMKALQERLQEPGGLGHVESVLIEKGLIAQTKSGRTLTGPGIKRAKLLVAAAEAA